MSALTMPASLELEVQEDSAKNQEVLKDFLTNPRTEYEKFPTKVKLTNLVTILNDIWEDELFS